MNDQLAYQIIEGHAGTGQAWSDDQYNTAHWLTSRRLLHEHSVTGMAPKTVSGLAIYGGRYFKTADDKPIYLLDLDKKRAILPVFKTARQKQAVLAAVHRHATANFAVGVSDATVTMTRFPPQDLNVDIINDPDAFLRTCEKKWKDWPLIIAVDFVLDGDSMHHTTISFAENAS